MWEYDYDYADDPNDCSWYEEDVKNSENQRCTSNAVIPTRGTTTLKEDKNSQGNVSPRVTTTILQFINGSQFGGN
jgi:hypothetical protein